MALQLPFTLVKLEWIEWIMITLKRKVSRNTFLEIVVNIGPIQKLEKKSVDSEWGNKSYKLWPLR